MLLCDFRFAPLPPKPSVRFQRAADEGVSYHRVRLYATVRRDDMPLKSTVNRVALDRVAGLLKQAGNAADRVSEAADSVSRTADAAQSKARPAVRAWHAAAFASCWIGFSAGGSGREFSTTKTGCIAHPVFLFVLISSDFRKYLARVSRR